MDKIIFERYQKMLEYQEKISPFTPRISELCKIWGVDRSATHLTLKRMLKNNLVVTRNIGKNKKEYFAIMNVN